MAGPSDARTCKKRGVGLKTGMMSGGEFANALFRLSVKAQIVYFTFETLTATIHTEIELPIHNADAESPGRNAACGLLRELKPERREWSIHWQMTAVLPLTRFPRGPSPGGVRRERRRWQLRVTAYYPFGQPARRSAQGSPFLLWGWEKTSARASTTRVAS